LRKRFKICGLKIPGKEVHAFISFSALPALYNFSLKALQYRALDIGNEIIFIDEVNHMTPVSWIDLRGEHEEKLYAYIAAEVLGYSSSKYFIYVFKRNKGVSPNQFKCIMNS